MPRVAELPCTIEAYEVPVVSQVSGLLKSLGTDKDEIDIGSVVKKGDILAIIDVPDIEKQVQRNQAALDQAKARVLQMEAKVGIAKADVESAKAQIVQAQANARSAGATTIFYHLKYDRIHYLTDKTVLEGKLEEEAKKQYDAAVEAENAAKAAIDTSIAKKTSDEARVKLAEADLTEAEAQVKVAKAELDQSQVRLGFATITARFDGKITQRSHFPGDFIRSASEGSGSQSILTIQRPDKMYAVVHIPSLDAPYADKGDPATIVVDALPNLKISAKLSRVPKAEDRGTRLMRVEIDLDNGKGLLHQGMFGKATIILDPALKQISIPRQCLVGNTVDGANHVFVVRGSKAYKTAIRVGMTDHRRVEVLDGVTTNDSIVLNPPSSFADGAEVNATAGDDR
jgi:RND family efflux transporter MFP subunit